MGMTDNATDSPKILNCETLASKGKLRVVINPSAFKIWQALDDQVSGRLLRILEQWCDQRNLLPKMHNKNEGRTAKFNIRMEAFKSFKVRFYGFERSIDGQRIFIIADADPAKKQDKADPAILKRSKSRIDAIEDELRKIEIDTKLNETKKNKGARDEQRNRKW
jgi:hypothetical protein